MGKKIRLIRTMVVEYEPNPKDYPDGATIEEMAQMDTETNDINSFFSGKLMDDEVVFEIVEDKN